MPHQTSPPPAYVRLRHRPLGQGDYADEDLLHLARGVYTVALNAAHLSKGDVEYYVEAAWNSGEKRSYPPTAPEQAATLVVC